MSKTGIINEKILMCTNRKLKFTKEINSTFILMIHLATLATFGQVGFACWIVGTRPAIITSLVIVSRRDSRAGGVATSSQAVDLDERVNEGIID